MERDKLFPLRPGFTDPAFADQVFYCWHCALMEGVLASFPDLARRLDVERIAWPKPRRLVVDLIGIANQSLPVLVLADDAPGGLHNGEWNGRRFIEGKDSILAALTIRHGFPAPHP